MKKKLIFPSLFLATFLFGCRVVFITGYDMVIDETATKIKRDFAVLSIKLNRAFQTIDGNKDQDIKNFLDFYDNMEADLKILEERAVSLPKKSSQVKQQVVNIKSQILEFEQLHKSGFNDLGPGNSDDHHTEINAVNRSFNALLKLQEALKTKGK